MRSQYPLERMENAWASSLWVSRLSERVDEGKVASQESKCYSKCYTKRESFESECMVPIVGESKMDLAK